MVLDDYRRTLPRIAEINADVEGCLTLREAEFLALAAAWPTANGVILEIGSFKGRSTIILCHGKSIGDKAPLISIDPLTSPSSTDPRSDEGRSDGRDFYINLERYGVRGEVEFHQCLSNEVAGQWNRPVRFLWIDGDHTYKGTKQDFENFSPALSDGAIIAFHDILIGYDGPIRVFMEDILLSENFCVAGMCGSIGWAQYRKAGKATAEHQKKKSRLYRRLAALVPRYVYREYYAGRVSHHMYRLLRARVPHKGVRPEAWIKEVEVLCKP